MVVSRARRPADLLVFDLDGTLIDSAIDISRAVNYALGRNGLAELPLATIRTLIGDGAPVLLRRALDAAGSSLDVEPVLSQWRSYYRDHLLDDTVLCPGAREVLELFKHKKLAVLTNKPAEPSAAILRGLGIEHYFFSMIGGDSLPTRKPDPQGLHRILDESAVPAERAVLIGDSLVDLETARHAGVTSCIVAGGIGAYTLDGQHGDVEIYSLKEFSDWFE